MRAITAQDNSSTMPMWTNVVAPAMLMSISTTEFLFESASRHFKKGVLKHKTFSASSQEVMKIFVEYGSWLPIAIGLQEQFPNFYGLMTTNFFTKEQGYTDCNARKTERPTTVILLMFSSIDDLHNNDTAHLSHYSLPINTTW